MPRIPYPRPESLDDEARRCMQGVPPINVLRMLSHSGPLLAGFGAFGQRVLYSLDLDPVLREMAIVRVGHLCRCGYELAQHERFIAGRRRGPPHEPGRLAVAHAAHTNTLFRIGTHVVQPI